MKREAVKNGQTWRAVIVANFIVLIEMIIQIFGSMKNQNTPNPKRTRFSEHPVVYEYSSKSKKEDPDNDSLLLDNDEDPSLTNNSDSQPQQKNQQIHSIKSGLD